MDSNQTAVLKAVTHQAYLHLIKHSSHRPKVRLLECKQFVGKEEAMQKGEVLHHDRQKSATNS
jgi:hypothetical protein